LIGDGDSLFLGMTLFFVEKFFNVLIVVVDCSANFGVMFHLYGGFAEFLRKFSEVL